MSDDVVRGCTVTFSVVFKDGAGNVVTPANASVFLSYPSASGARATTELTLVLVSGVWTVSWDSGHARPGEVLWSAQSKGTSPAGAQDGSFNLTANKANPDNSD